MVFQRLSRDCKLRQLSYPPLAPYREADIALTLKLMPVLRPPVEDWLAEDPPTWEWEHDPSYMSLRQQRIARRWSFGWSQFTRRCRWHPNQAPPEWRLPASP